MKKAKTDIVPQADLDTSANREFVARILEVHRDEVARVFFLEREVKSFTTGKFYCLGSAQLRDGRPVCFIAHYNTDPRDDNPEREAFHEVLYGYAEACPVA